MRSLRSPPALPGQCSSMRKGAWTQEEDAQLREYVEMYGPRNWRDVSRKAGLNRCRKSCRNRWLNYLSPSVKKGPFEEEEEDLIIRLHRLLGNRWSLIAGRIPGRTANDVKNHWNIHLRKKVYYDQPNKENNDGDLKVIIKPKARVIPPNWTWPNDQAVQPDQEQHNLTTLLDHVNNAANHEDFLDYQGEFNCPVFGNGSEATKEDLQTITGDEVVFPEVGGWENLFLDSKLLEDLLSV